MQPTQSAMLLRTSSGTSPRATTSETAKRPPGLSTRKVSRSTRVFVRREIDDAIGDDHVDGVVGQRDVFDFALEELDVFDAGLALVFAGKGEHVVGHVEAVGFAGGADAPGREQHIDAAAGAEVEHGFARLELDERGGIAAAQRGEHGVRRQAALLRFVVEVGGDGVAAGESRGCSRPRRPIAAPGARRLRTSLEPDSSHQ